MNTLSQQLSLCISSDKERGILRIDVPPFPSNDGISIRYKMRFIIYVSVDASGSMCETATKHVQPHQSKMDFVHMTLTNMIEYIASQEEENPHAEFYIAIVKFGSFASCSLLPCRVTKENKDLLIRTVLDIIPGGGTNFQKCFDQVAHLMSTEQDYIKPDESISEDFTKRMHIFLTDGANNEGEKNVQQLASILAANISSQKPVTQIMIGYGHDHDSVILQQLCGQFPKSKQWFIDEIEKTGCIFGEILWSAMNTVYTGVKISSNGELFDFATMSWKNELEVDDIVYDSSRTFYIRFPPNTESVVCEMSHFSLESKSHSSRVASKTISSNESAVDGSSTDSLETTSNQSVENELWRLDTIITIDEALKFLQNMRQFAYNALVEEKNRLIGVVTTFQEKFIAYVSEKNLNDDPFMIQLADDLFVCISGLMATAIGERYVAARQVSQIQQRSVTVNDITPLQVEFLSSIPMSSRDDGNVYSDDFDDCLPMAPRRAQSSGGFVGDDNRQSSPRTPTRQTAQEPTLTIDASTTAQIDKENTEEKENEKIVSDLTPSSRGIGSRLRHLSRETIMSMRKPRGNGYDRTEDDIDQYYSSGGGIGDDTFSSHASPGCAHIARMLSAPIQRSSAPNRTSTSPF